MKKALVFLLLALLSCNKVFNKEGLIPFCVSIVRPDGVLVPFTIYDSEEWSNHWPGTFELKEAPPSTIHSLSDIPESWYNPLTEIPSEWYMRKMNGDSIVINISKPVIVETYCVETWGLLSNYPSIPYVKPHQWPLIKQGIALSSPVPTQHVEYINPYSYEWEEIREFVWTEFLKKENEAGHPLSESKRRTLGFGLSKLYFIESPIDSSFIYYFEAESNYSDHNLISRRSPYGISFYKGWINKNYNGKMNFIKSEMQFSNGFRIGISRYQPLGAILLDNKTYWVVELDGYEGESYVIFDVSKKGIINIIKIHGGGC